MICSPCQVAGTNNHIANHSFTDYERESYQATARNYHMVCTAPSTCTCQHVVGQVIKGASDG